MKLSMNYLLLSNLTVNGYIFHDLLPLCGDTNIAWHLSILKSQRKLIIFLFTQFTYYLLIYFMMYFGQGWKCSGFWWNSVLFLWIFTPSNLPIIPLVLIILVESYSHWRVTYFYMIEVMTLMHTLSFHFCIFLLLKSYSAPETPCCLH